MTASDQETPVPEPASVRAPVPVPESATVPEPVPAPETATVPEPAPELLSEPVQAPEHEGMTPRQARTLRIVVASVLLVALAAVLAVRLASRTSVLVVGVYGLAMILCGVVIELSRHGRTRLGTWLLGAGLVAALAADWLLLP
ncbi:hypothetical protein ACFU5O_00740 [Streptomyces sp. NPDC057445]|uniref:hypothetical protein n=1 Tax=Streptomyces sp. NPDC057445 TaxID=3346136 RepID=UPI0036ADB651